MARSAVRGAAQRPRLAWAPNPGGLRRTPEEAIALARRWGVEIGEDVRLVWNEALVDSLVGSPAKGEIVWACYFGATSTARLTWNDFLVQGRLPVKVRERVLESDESIVAVLAHEMFEVNRLRTLFEERGTISAIEVSRLIQPDKPGNLHDQAWDEADRIVQAMRRGDACSP